TAVYTLSLHDALPIYRPVRGCGQGPPTRRHIEPAPVAPFRPAPNAEASPSIARSRSFGGILTGKGCAGRVDQRPDGDLGCADARSEEHTSELQSRENL